MQAYSLGIPVMDWRDRGGFIGLVLVGLPFGAISPQSVVIFTVGEESYIYNSFGNLISTEKSYYCEGL